MSDTIVIGGGVLGQLTALALAARGRSVVLLDAGASAPPASWAGGGILSALFPWRYPDALTTLTRHALQDYRELGRRIIEAGGVDPEARQTGMLVHARDDASVAQQWAGHWNVQVLPGDAEAVPAVLRRADAVWLPDVGTIRNPRLLKGLHRLLSVVGVRALHDAPVTGLRREGEVWCAETPQGHFRAGQVLVAAGAWASALLRPQGLDLPVRPVQGEMLLYGATCPAPPGVILAEDGYVIPRADGQMLVGSTLRDSGYDQRPTGAAHRQLMALAGRLWAPLAGETPVAQWAGLRPGSDRLWPWLGEVPGTPGLFVGAGHYRNGLVSAPASASLLAALMCGTSAPFDPAPYGLDGLSR